MFGSNTSTLTGGEVKQIYACLLAVFLSMFAAHADACSTFVIETDDELVFGRSLDWKTSVGLVIVNKRGLHKTALADPPEKPISWVSKYGSVTFNQVGRELPYGGMNEAGLVVENMTLRQTEYPKPDNRPIACEVQWIQYQLDNHSTVKEVIRSDKDLRISQAESNLHFLVADRDGNVASIEFLGGKMVVHTGERFPVPVLTNCSYGDGIWHLRDKNFDADEMPNFHIWRMAVASKMIEDYKTGRATGEASKSAVDYSFTILNSILHKTMKWRVVYDIAKLKVYFNTNEQEEIKSVDLGAFDFACETPAKMIDINTSEGGDVSDSFVDYDPEVNFTTIARAFEAFKKTGFLEHYDESDLREYSRFCDGYKCGAATD